MQAGQLSAAQSGAWSIKDSKRVNHKLSKPAVLKHAASQTDLHLSLVLHNATTFTVEVHSCQSDLIAP